MTLRIWPLMEPRDWRVGVCWKRYRSYVDEDAAVDPPEERLDVYVCLLPCLPLRLRLAWVDVPELLTWEPERRE